MVISKVAEEIVEEMEGLKLEEIKSYDVSGFSALTDELLVASAESMVQIEAARNHTENKMSAYGFRLKNPREDWHGGWLLMDYGDLIIHVLLREKRSFYRIDDFIRAGQIKPEEIANASRK